MKLSRAILVAVSAWVGAFGSSGAQDAATPPAVADAAEDVAVPDGSAAPGEANGGIDALIKQLGADDFKDREAAVAKLKRVGQPALPALKRALEDADPEVATRADAVIRELRRPPAPARLPGVRGDPAEGVGDAGVEVHMSAENGKRRVEVREPGRTIRIDEGPDGIQMAVTGQVDGEEVTRDFQARTPEQLRQQNAEAFELYDRFAGRGGAVRARGGMVMPGGVVIPGGGGMIVRRGMPRMGRVERIGPVPGRPNDPFEGADEFGELHELLQRQVRDARMPAGQRREMAGLLERLREIEGGEPLADGEQADPNDADALRRRLEKLELPGAGHALSAPPRSHLGITVDEDSDEGVTVLHVMPDSRAERLGLEPLDVITRMNGTDVTDARDLRRAMTGAEAALVIEGTRDGEPLKLEEKPGEPTP